MNILIFPSGTGVSKEIFDSLKYIRWINIVGIDTDQNNFSYYQFETFEPDAPFVKQEQETLEYLKRIIAKYKIDCIFPAFDNVIRFLKKYESLLNVKIISSPIDTCELCFSKKRTYDFFTQEQSSDITLRIPKILQTEEVTEFPVFIKPECGYGSRDSFKINNREELDFYSANIKDVIICEYLPGDEFTIDCFTSQQYGLIYCEARSRSKTVNGLSVLTKHVELPDIRKIGEYISSKLKFIGVWFFQLKYNRQGQLTLLEIAPRIPGAACLHRNKGINFPLLSIYEHCGNSVDSVLINNYEISCYKCVENRFKLSIQYTHVYVDLDDTIILKQKVNTKMVQYLYYAKNLKKTIILLTRNKDPDTVLEKYHIHSQLFDQIIRVDKERRKSEFIDNSYTAIFIDDSYKEREDVYNTNKICVFSCDMIEAIMDEKL